ncbi:MAG: NAD(P)/FAD-dependent oxidoreductase, partial [Pseudomonadota bacterium]
MSASSEFKIDCVVAGAGVVGLATARALAMAGREVMIVERAQSIGTQTSARNSEVIHAGIYYPPGSLKAVTCVHGKWALYAYLSSHGIAHRRCEKLIVAANEEEVEHLSGIAARAERNGVDDLEFLSGAKARKLEPVLSAAAAIRSPSTGVLDSHAYMHSLLGEAEDHGATLALKTEILGGTCLADGRTQLLCGGAEPCKITTSLFVNAGGLYAPRIAGLIDGFPATEIPTPYLAKGHYFTLAGRAPFSRLIYPVPVGGGLGIHLTLDLGGQARFGPDVEWVEEIDYTVDPRRGDAFYGAVRRYWPDLKNGALMPAYSGIRPKIAGPGEPAADFVVAGPDRHGVEGQVHL